MQTMAELSGPESMSGACLNGRLSESVFVTASLWICCCRMSILFSRGWDKMQKCWMAGSRDLFLLFYSWWVLLGVSWSTLFLAAELVGSTILSHDASHGAILFINGHSGRTTGPLFGGISISISILLYSVPISDHIDRWIFLIDGSYLMSYPRWLRGKTRTLG
jgi:hypothetical protein